MNWFKTAVTLSATLFLTLVLSTRFGSLPPAGQLLNPFQGFWQNMAQIGLKKHYNIRSDKLSDTVQIVFDERKVPRIFAQNDYDLFFAQGYVQARDRLWQLDFQARAAAGRLSEVLGHQTLNYDRYQRRLGMVHGAEQVIEYMNSYPETRIALEAYTEGINTYIERLRKAHYPVEYKLMSSEPELFTPLKSALLLMSMSQTLNFSHNALRFSNTEAILGKELTARLFPQHSPLLEPVMSRDARWDFEPLQSKISEDDFIPEVIRDLQLTMSDPSIGSNSWAVSGSKTKSGAAILVNDPHLGLTLPSIWYEMQLNSPDVNVYGVSLLGAPGIIIGFNDHLGWGSTNSGSFALDIFEIEFRDESRREYLHDGQWKPVIRVVEEIKVRNFETVRDTVLYTHHGPVVQPDGQQIMYQNIPKGHAIQWMSHKPSNELLAYYKMNRAQNLDEFTEGLRHFEKPSQLKSYADVHGNIGNFNVGTFPVRFHEQGLRISDGRNPAYDWDSWIPFEHMPREINPPRGFISSANQPIVDESYPYYLGQFYADFSRATRINKILEQSTDINKDFMQRMLMDSYSSTAEYVLPWMLDTIDLDAITPFSYEIISHLQDWDFYQEADNHIAFFFQRLWGRMFEELWKPYFEDVLARVIYPTSDQTIYLLTNQQYDDFPRHPAEVLNSVFTELTEEFSEKYGEDISSWHYGSMRTNRIPHLAQLPGFGREKVVASGHSDAINAYRGTHGPSWRMIVEFTKPITARVIYPGGQTGNPAHREFDKMVDGWITGEMYEVRLVSSPDELITDTKSIRLRP